MEVNKVYPQIYPLVADWYKLRELTPPAADVYPELGFVAHYEGIPVAVAFIRRVEGGYGQLDGLCSNPDFPGDMRSEAIDSVVLKIIHHAQHIGIKGLIAHSKDTNTLLRAKKHGFVQSDQTIIALNLQAKAEEHL